MRHSAAPRVALYFVQQLGIEVGLAGQLGEAHLFQVALASDAGERTELASGQWMRLY